MDPGDVGDVAAADGEVERAVQLGESAGEITGRRQRHAEGVASVTLVAGRSGGDGDGDCLGGASGRHARADRVGRGRRRSPPARAPEPRSAARPGRGRSPARRHRGHRRRDRAATDTSRAARGGSRRGRRAAADRVSASASAISWAARSRSPARLATSAARSTISARDTGRSAACALLVGIERRQQPVVVALGLRQRIRQLGIDRGGEGGGHGAVVATRRRPVVDEGGRPPGSDEAVVEVDRPGEGGVHGGPLTREQLAEHRLVDEGVTKRVPLLVDEQEVVLTGRAEPGVEHVGGQLDRRGQQTMADPAPADRRGPHDQLGALVETIETGEQQFVEPRRDVPLARTRRRAPRRRTGCRRSVRARR